MIGCPSDPQRRGMWRQTQRTRAGRRQFWIFPTLRIVMANRRMQLALRNPAAWRQQGGVWEIARRYSVS